MVRMQVTLSGTGRRVRLELGRLVWLVLPATGHSGHVTALLGHPARGRRVVVVTDQFLHLSQCVRSDVLVIVSLVNCGSGGGGGVFWQGVATAGGVRVAAVVFGRAADPGTHATVPGVLMVGRRRRVASPDARHPDLRQLNRGAVVAGAVVVFCGPFVLSGPVGHELRLLLLLEHTLVCVGMVRVVRVLDVDGTVRGRSYFHGYGVLSVGAVTG